MAKSLLSVKSKKRTVSRTPKYTDTKFTGDEPNWSKYDRLDQDKQRLAWHHAFFFYNYHNTPGEMRKYVVEYGQKYRAWTKNEVAAFSECDDGRVGQTLCSYAKCVLDGAPEQNFDFVEKKLSELLEYGNQQLLTKASKETVAQKKTVQDHMRDKQGDMLADLDSNYDSWMSGADTLLDFVAFFRERNMPQQFVGRIREYYNAILEEVYAAKSSDDEQLKQGYAWAKKAELKQISDWHHALNQALDTYGAVKKATRAVRKPRPLSKEKLVKKIKFAAEHKPLNLVSVNPVDIIGCHTLWVYNIKTRKLGRYVAADDSKQLNIKGSTIIGYDEKQSVAKTLRKPETQVAEFMKSGKVALRNYLDNIKTTSVQLNGRINTDTILLKVVK